MFKRVLKGVFGSGFERGFQREVEGSLEVGLEWVFEKEGEVLREGNTKNLVQGNADEMPTDCRSRIN